MKELKKNKGITLIALVITIIVLLILAGISISALTGSGIFEKAKQAIEKDKYARTLEKVQLAVTASYDETGNINNEYLYENLDNIDGKEELKENEDKSAYLVKVDGYYFLVSKSTGEVSKKDIEVADGEIESDRDATLESLQLECNNLKDSVADLKEQMKNMYNKSEVYSKIETDAKIQQMELNSTKLTWTLLESAPGGNWVTKTVTDITNFKYLQVIFKGSGR